MLSTLVCIPAFNEEKAISSLIQQIKKITDKIVVCDDGSNDRTSQIAEEEGAKVLRHQKNKGKGAALKSLFEYAKNSTADVIVTIDGDGQFLPNQISDLIQPILKENFDVVIGNRYGDSTEMPNYRKFGNKILDKMTNLAVSLPFNDTQSGFRAYSKKAVDSIKFESSGFAADSEILINASNLGLKISEVPVTVIYNTGGKTSTTNPVTQSKDVLGSLLELIAIRHALLFLGLPGLILFTVGIIFGSIVVSTFNETRWFSIEYTLLSLGAILFGLILIMVSVILFSIQRTQKRV